MEDKIKKVEAVLAGERRMVNVKIFD